MITALALILLLFAGPAFAQTWQCLPALCVPGSPNCACTPVPQQQMAVPAPVAPNCPAMTGQMMSFWNGITCQLPAPPAVDTSLLQQQMLQQQIFQQQMQQQRIQEWQREQWRAQHPEGPGGDHGGDRH